MVRAFIFLILLVYSLLDACTGIQLHPKDGSHVHGRTLEFGVYIDTDVIMVPRGYKFQGKTPSGPGKSYTAKYASLGIMAYTDVNILDGINEKGLAVGAFYFPTFASYTTVTKENQSKGLSPADFSNWILTQFSTVEEVRKAVENGEVVITPTILKGWGDTPLPLHYIVYDKSGNCLVIEPLEEKLVLYNNPLGVFTNSPPLDWHLVNLRNFIGLRPHNVEPITVDDYTIKPLGQGSGMVGLPGDFTPPSRFVRAAIFTVSAMPAKDAESGIFQVFHILNNFDIPIGSTREKVGGKLMTDYTMLTVARDPQHLRFYYRSYADQTIRMVDLTKFDFNGKEIKSLSTKDTQPVVEMTDKLR